VRALHPLLGGTADFNFTESIGFLQQISQAAETNSYGLRRLAAQLTDIEPEVRHYFATLTEQASRRTAANLRTPPSGHVPSARPSAAATAPTVAVQPGANSRPR